MNGEALVFRRVGRGAPSGRWRPAAVTLLVLVPIVVASCGGEGGGGGDGRTGSSTSAVPRSETGTAESPPVSWRFESPASWDERVRVADDPEGTERLAAQGIRSARLFEYLPRDTSVVPQTLLGIYAYDSTAWARLAAEEGPPQGELLAYWGGVAYVAGLPQSNPFAPTSEDFAEFERRSVTLAYVRGAFRVVP